MMNQMMVMKLKTNDYMYLIELQVMMMLLQVMMLLIADN